LDNRDNHRDEEGGVEKGIIEDALVSEFPARRYVEEAEAEDHAEKEVKAFHD
jgi:hypothetical protein